MDYSYKFRKEKPFLKIGSEQLTYHDFATFLYKSQRKLLKIKPIKVLIKEQYTYFLNTKLLAYHEENLESENLEFAEIINQYREGLLLFDLMEIKIWEAVKLDTIGLQNYYNTNKDSYFWQERIEAVVATSAKESSIKDVLKMLNKENDIEKIKADLNKNDALNVIFTSDVMNAEHQALPKGFIFRVGISQVYFYNDAYHVIYVKRILPKTYKTLDKVRGRVLADFQDEIEKQWLKKLYKTYKVNINNDILLKVKNQIHNN